MFIYHAKFKQEKIKLTAIHVIDLTSIAKMPVKAPYQLAYCETHE